MISRAPVGALDLFSTRPGSMSDEGLDGSLWVAELAALPLLDLMTSDVDWEAAGADGDGWKQLGSLRRVGVYHAGRGLPGHRHDRRRAGRRPGADDDLELGQALAYIAAVAIVQDRPPTPPRR